MRMNWGVYSACNLVLSKWRFWDKKGILFALLSLKIWTVQQMCTILCRVLLFRVLDLLECGYSIRRTHLGKGRMGSTMLLLLVPMELHHQLPISSLKGMYSDLLLREIHDRMHLAAVACIHFIINIGISIPSHREWMHVLLSWTHHLLMLYYFVQDMHLSAACVVAWIT